MKIIEMGLNKRIGDVQEQVETKDAEVVNAVEQVERFTQILLNHPNEEVAKIAFQMDTAISLLLTTSIEAAYRIGISEGMQLQQEINALRIGGWK